MDDSEKEDFAVAITAMLETFGAEGTKPQLLGYWYALQDMSLQEVQEGVYKAMRTAKRRPMPSEVRELAEGGSSDERAIEAWGDVMNALPRGPYKWVDFDDSVINASIRHMGGWPTFVARFANADAEKWVRIEFLKCYTTLASRRLDGEVCDPLPGLSEVSAVNGELGPPVPVRIGCNQDRAKLSPPKSRKHTQRIGEPIARIQGVPQ